MKIDLKNLPKASLEFMEPMLANPVARLPRKGDWLYKVKLDGLIVWKFSKWTISGHYPVLR